MAQLLAVVALVVATLALAACVLERRASARLPLADLVLERYGAFAWRPALTSSLYGAFLVGAPVAPAAALGLVRLRWADGVGVAAVAALLLPVRFAWAAMEELMMRGALLPRAARLVGPVGALGASSLLFALAHLERTGSRTPDLWSVVGYALEGLAFALVFLETRSLWAPTVFHAMKNVAVALVGSSTVLPHGALLAVEPTGASRWMGPTGQFGILLARRMGAELAADLAWVSEL